MFKGLRTAIYFTPDVAASKAWYSRALGVEPYFESPGYVGFEVGGFELGLDPDSIPAGQTPTGAMVYWGVDSIEETVKHLMSIGAKEHRSIQDVGDDIKLASVLDPFGNVFGIIQNPSFKQR